MKSHLDRLVLLPGAMSRRSILTTTAAFFAICLLLSLYLFGPSYPSSSIDVTSHTSSDCVVDIDVLRTLGLNESTAEYARLEIHVERSEAFGGFSDDIFLPLPSFQSIALDAGERRQPLTPEICSSIVSMGAPPVPSSKPDASHILFGVATSLERLDGSLDAFAHWAGGTNTRILAVIEPHPDASLVEHRARKLGFTLTIIQSDAEYLDRYFSLVRAFFQHRDENTLWAAFIDDDTFFPSMSNLVSRLGSYDAGKPQYIGGISEDFGQMYNWGYMAYGGAGIFISMPLLDELDRFYDACNAAKVTGDRRLARCIYAHTTTKLTWEPGLHQLDLHGDASGFYESGRPLPLSLHHWKSWFDVDMVALSKVASVCGEECLLRRWRFADDWYLINGFGLVKYSAPLNKKEGEDLRMEMTWQESAYAGGDGFEHTLGPLRPKDEGKISFRLCGAIRCEEEGGEEGGGNCVRQFYVRQQPESSNGPDQVLEVVWRSV